MPLPPALYTVAHGWMCEAHISSILHKLLKCESCAEWCAKVHWCLLDTIVPFYAVLLASAMSCALPAPCQLWLPWCDCGRRWFVPSCGSSSCAIHPQLERCQPTIPLFLLIHRQFGRIHLWLVMTALSCIIKGNMVHRLPDVLCLSHDRGYHMQLTLKNLQLQFNLVPINDNWQWKWTFSIIHQTLPFRWRKVNSKFPHNWILCNKFWKFCRSACAGQSPSVDFLKHKNCFLKALVL